MSPLSVTKSRHRASTAELLGASFIIPEHNLPLPEPEKSALGYTDARIRQCLQFAEQRLNHRRITPKSAVIIENYKVASKAALLADEEGTRNMHIAVIRTFEEVLQTEIFLRQEHPGLVELEHELLRLRRLIYLARYGDYLGARVEKIRYFSGEKNTKGYQDLSAHNQWKDFAEKIESEAKVGLDASLTNAKHAGLHVTNAVRVASDGLGIRATAMFWAIKQDAERNAAVHNNVYTLLDKCQWHELAVNLQDDLDELPAVISPRDEQDLKEMRTILEEVRDEWFDIAGPDPDDAGIICCGAVSGSRGRHSEGMGNLGSGEWSEDFEFLVNYWKTKEIFIKGKVLSETSKRLSINKRAYSKLITE